MEKRRNLKLAGGITVLLLMLVFGLLAVKGTVFSREQETDDIAEKAVDPVWNESTDAALDDYTDDLLDWNNTVYYDPDDSEIISEENAQHSPKMRLRAVGVREVENDFRQLDVVRELEANHTYITQIFLENISSIDAMDVRLGVYLPDLVCADCGGKMSIEAHVEGTSENGLEWDWEETAEYFEATEDLVLEYIPDSVSTVGFGVGGEGVSCMRSSWETAQVMDGSAVLEAQYDRLKPGEVKMVTFRFRTVKRAEYEATEKAREKDPLKVELQGIYGATDEMKEMTPETLTSAELWRMLQQGKIDDLRELVVNRKRQFAIVTDVTVPQWISTDGNDGWLLEFKVDYSLLDGTFKTAACLYDHELGYDWTTDELKLADEEEFSEVPHPAIQGIFLWDSQSGTLVQPYMVSYLRCRVEPGDLKPGKYYLVVVCG